MEACIQIGWAMADLVIILYSNSLLPTADLRFVLESALTCFVLLSLRRTYLFRGHQLHSIPPLYQTVQYV